MYKEIYNKFYSENPDSVHLDPVRFKAISELCVGTVLDIGCGTADLFDFIDNKYIGVDVSDVAVNKAVRKFGSRAKFICSDVTKEKLPLDEKVNTIVMAEFLEHVKNDDFKISDILNYFDKGGRIIVSVPNGDSVPDKNHLNIFTVPKLRKIFSEYGKVKFYNWLGAEKRILMTCDVGVFEPPKISLCMILKNEAKGMEKSILSAIEFVDEIVLFVDDSSNDETLEIAKNYGDVVQLFKWENDFSAARNLAQSHCLADWVFILDGHEYVNKVYNVDFSKLDDFDAVWCRIKYEHGLSFAFPRIIRKNIKWQDAVHNRVMTDKVYKNVALKIIHDRENLQSDEASQERNEQRSKMISEIMGERIKKDKKDLRAVFYYAVHEQTQKNYKQAIKLYKHYLKYSKNHEERWYVVMNVAACYMLLNKPVRAFYWAQSTENEIAGRWENAHLCATVLVRFQKFEKALPYIAEAMKDDTKTHMYYPFKRDLSELWDMIGVCFVGLYLFPKAVIAFERAIHNTTDQKRIAYLTAKVQAIQTITQAKKTEPIENFSKGKDNSFNTDI